MVRGFIYGQGVWCGADDDRLSAVWTMSKQQPERANVVIIGGGIMGVSAAYHLAAAGVSDVVVLERHSLGSGSTSKAAGGVRTQFSDRANIELGARSMETFTTFEERFGQAIDLRQHGYLFLLDDPADVAAFEANVALQNSLGVASRMIDVAEAQNLSPYIDTEGLLAAAYGPDDGHCTPESVLLGFAQAARRLGVVIRTGCEVVGIDLADDGQITAVRTAHGPIRTDTVICAAGAWSAEVGRWVGVDLPVTPLRRQILVTEPIDDLPDDLAFTIDFSTSFYFHPESRGLLMGMSDPDETPGFKLTRSDAWLPRLSEVIARRAPRLAEVGIASGWAGLYEDTPDHNALIGEAPRVGRFLYATGFSGHGFLQGPAVGEVLRDLYLHQPTFTNIGGFDARRFESDSLQPEKNIV